MIIPTYIQDVKADLDYTFDWTAYLETTETILTAVETAATGLTLGTSTISADGKSVVFWLSGGVVGVSYRIDCLITTSAGRTDNRSMYLTIEDL